MCFQAWLHARVGTGRSAQHINVLTQKIGDLRDGPIGIEYRKLERVRLTTKVRCPRIHSLITQFRLRSRPCRRARR